MSITYTIAGFDLHQPDLGFYLMEQTDYAPQISPNRVNLNVPHLHGQVPLWNDELTETKLYFRVRVKGSTPAELQYRWEHLRSLMWTGSNQGLTIRRVIGEGPTAQITSTFAQLETMSRPDFYCAAGMIDVDFILNCPSGRWQSIESFTFDFPTTSVAYDIPFVSESTAPNTNPLIRIRGPFTSNTAWIRLTDQTSRTGVHVQPGVQFNNTQYVVVDLEQYRMWLNTTDDFDAREQEISGQLRTLRGGLLSLVPIPSFDIDQRSSAVVWTRSVNAVNSAVSIRGRRTYI